MDQVRQVLRYHHYAYRHLLDQPIQRQFEPVKAKREPRPLFIWAAQKKRLRKQLSEGAFEHRPRIPTDIGFRLLGHYPASQTYPGCVYPIVA